MKFRFFDSSLPTFNVLCLGERGTGKTVFLIGSYTEFLQYIEKRENALSVSDNDFDLFFECQDIAEKFLLNNILQYVTAQGVYPPPTLKITDFHFAFKQQKQQQNNTLCYIRWWDMPGEYCNFNNPYYQKMVEDSHAFCLFINAYRLVEDESYGETFSYIQDQLMIVISLIKKYRLNYPIALIFTQCDRLCPELPPEKQIEEKTETWLDYIKGTGIDYHCFYSSVKIEPQLKGFKLVSNGISAVLLWLISQLYENYSGRQLSNLRILSVLHCLYCGSDHLLPSRSLALLNKIGLLLTLRRIYRCRSCGETKIEFLPWIFLKWLYVKINKI